MNSFTAQALKAFKRILEDPDRYKKLAIEKGICKEDDWEHMLRLMRRHINQPVVAFCHLSLTALQLYRLRYGLIQRALFNDVATEEPS